MTKKALVNFAKVSYIHEDSSTQTMTDASNSIGAVLYQKQIGIDKPISFFSKIEQSITEIH